VPLLDAFGTRVSEAAVIEGLYGLGLESFSLLVSDSGLLLRIASGVSEGAAARAEIWLKGVFSPLRACRVERVPRRLLRKGIREVALGDRRPILVAAVVEMFEPGDLPAVLPQALARLGLKPGAGLSPGPGRFLTLPEWRKGRRWSAAAGPVFLSWRRPGGAKGVRPAWLLAASLVPAALDLLARSLVGEPHPERGSEVLLDGLEWAVGRRPTVAAPAPAGFVPPIVADPERCGNCGLCSRICPADCLLPGGSLKSKAKAEACLRCFDCVEACPQDALRPVYSASSATLSGTLRHRPGWLSRLAGGAGPALPLAFPPAYLLPKPGSAGKPKLVLGVAVTTLQEHAAALLKEGKVHAAVEEERFSRRRHHGWHAPDRPGVSIAMDPTLAVEDAFPRAAIAAILGPDRLSLDDMDLIAVNGIPARYRRAFSALESGRAIPSLKAGRVVYVPHHLAHAASAYRASGMDDAWVLTVDGRGDRETAAVFRGKGAALEPVLEVLSLTDRSIGGVYETVTRLLGFGPHGQGSVMALASFGRPRRDVEPFLSWKGSAEPSIHEKGIDERFASLARSGSDPLTRPHQDLAASLQRALERTITGLLKTAGIKPGVPGLCLAGGVALNCRMNQVLRETFRPLKMFVQPGANDAGTALGAALEALHLAGGPARAAMPHALLGPAYDSESLLRALRRAKASFTAIEDAPAEAARRLAEGQVVCWFDGRVEFGPRALGSRSILADPRRPEAKGRVNRIKGREPWRPFGPSILSGHEAAWFAGAFDSRFMLFTLPLKKGRAAKVPAIVHGDGTSRPQVVRREHQPRYHLLLKLFHELTGVPMVLNTSFNRRGEPIVCSPEDALACFTAMAAEPGGPDCLFLGSFLVERSSIRPG
jgi:carbamoyltransferase